MPVYTPKTPDQKASIRVDLSARDDRLVAITLMDATDHAAAILTPNEAEQIATALVDAARRARGES